MTNQNLITLAKANFLSGGFGTWGNKLSMDEMGNFSYVSGIKAAWNRTKNDSFTGSTIQKKIRADFDQEINGIKEDTIDDGIMTSIQHICDAFQGFRKISKDYNSSLFKSTDEIAMTEKEIVGAIKKKLNRILYKNLKVQYNNSQNTFLDPKSYGFDYVGSGICWGIACYWCAEYLSNSNDIIQANSTQNQIKKYIVSRQNRAIDMFILMHNQNTILQEGGCLSRDGGLLGAGFAKPDGNEKKIFTQGTKPVLMSYQQASRNILAKIDPNERLTTYAEERAKSYANLLLEKSFKIKPIKKLKYVGPEHTEVQQTIKDLKAEASINKYNSAKLVYWKSTSGGHAMSWATSKLDSYFMDPNFGDWVGTEAYIENVIKLIISYYSFSHTLDDWYVQQMISNDMPNEKKLFVKRRNWLWF